MTYKSNAFFVIVLLWSTQISAYKEISGLLERATDLTHEELNALRPLFNHLQQQYDYIVSQEAEASLVQDDVSSANPQLAALYATTQAEFERNFGDLVQQYADESKNSSTNASKYNTTLPSLGELLGGVNVDLTTEALAERADIESLLQDARSEAQTKLYEIVYRSLQLESELIKINKPKIVLYVLQALSLLFKVAARGARAAYCTYSYIPELNASLHHIYDGVDCYTYSKRLLLRVEEVTVQTVSTIRKNVFSLAGIYESIAGKNSLLGKLATVLLNLPRIVRSIVESYLVGVSSLDKLQNELPDAAKGSVKCGREFVAGVPQIVEIAANLSTCIMFVDNTSNDYDFLKPENERDFNLLNC